MSHDVDNHDSLQLDINLVDPDGFYENLLNLHQGLSESQSAQLNAKLVLILANHIGDYQVLNQAFKLARRHL